MTRAHPSPRSAAVAAGAGLVLRGVALNLVLAVLKFAGGILGNTYALIADGVESLLDVVASLAVWGGFKVAARPPDENHPYGHGKAEPLVSLVVAGVIFFAAGWIAWHSVQEIRTPHAAPHWGTLPLLAGVIAAKEFFSRRLARAGRAVGSTALEAEAWHHRADALTSAAAVVGIAAALLGGPRWVAADDWAALGACAIIAGNGLVIARRSLDEIMDTVAPPAVGDQVRAVAAAVPGVLAVEKCRVLKSGMAWLVDIHVIVDGELSVRAGHDIAHAVKDALFAAAIAVGDVAVHVEPTQRGR